MDWTKGKKENGTMGQSLGTGYSLTNLLPALSSLQGILAKMDGLNKRKKGKWDNGTKGPRDQGTKGQWDIRTMGQWDNVTM